MTEENTNKAKEVNTIIIVRAIASVTPNCKSVSELKFGQLSTNSTTVELVAGSRPPITK